MTMMKSTIGCSLTVLVHSTEDYLFTQGALTRNRETHTMRHLPAGSQDGSLPDFIGNLHRQGHAAG
jgi:hypothetical protein